MEGAAEVAAAVGGSAEGGVGEECAGEQVVDVVDGDFRGVDHVGGVKAVIPQVVHHDFIGGEIADGNKCVFRG